MRSQKSSPQMVRLSFTPSPLDQTIFPHAGYNNYPGVYEWKIP